MSNAVLGGRVEVGGYRGFVRFVGKLPERGETTWLGIEWDDPSRGKHDGCADGIRYFKCTHATAGSFLKASKVGSGLGRSLLEAVTLRHAISGDDRGISALPETVGGRGGRVELVGAELAAERQRHVENASSIDLRGMSVGSIGDLAKLSSLLANLRRLDLGQCLLSNVAQIVELLTSLRDLEILDLSHNQFAIDDSSFVALQSTGRRLLADGKKSELRVLVLNHCNMPLRFILTIGNICPLLEELRLFKNRLESSETSGADVSSAVLCSLPHLKVLDVGDNGLSWHDLMNSFSALCHLESLFASNNAITTVRCKYDREEGSQAKPVPFAMLRTLSLRGNDIRDWRSISELMYLPKLAALWVNDISLIRDLRTDSAGESTVPDAISSRDGVIARLGNLSVLDGSSIHPDERLYAEKRYLRQCLRLYYEATRMSDVLRDHPRLHELCERYDVDLSGERSASLPGRETRISVRTLRTDLVSCTMVNRGGFAENSPALVTRKLPVSTPVGKVGGLVARSFGLHSASDVARLRLLVFAGGNERELELQDETRDLRHYGVEGGDDIRVHAHGCTSTPEP